MTEKEWYSLVRVLKSAYSQESFLPDKYSWTLYYSMLKDIPFDVMMLAVQKCIMEMVFPPKIADLRRIAVEIVEKPVLDWSEGWEEVLKCIGSYGYMRETEALEHMSEITGETVKKLGWQNICMSENIQVDRANFRTIYEQIAKRKKDQNYLPIDVKEKIFKIQQLAMQKIEVSSGDNYVGIIEDT